MIQELVLMVILLFFSAIFSASETALSSLSSIKIKRIQKHNRDITHLLRLLSDPSRFLTTILFGNMLVNIMLSTLLASILIRALGNRGLAISIGLATFLLLIFGEVFPKTLAIKKEEDMSYNLARSIDIFATIIFPFRKIFNTISDSIIKSFGISFVQEPTLTQEELKSVIELSHRQGLVKENEKEMIRSVLELTQTTAQEIMSPRPDIKALSLEINQEQAINYLKKIKHSKIPVYKDSIDNITGILYAKDLFFSPDTDFRTLVRPTFFVPATKNIDELLKDFHSQNSKIAIVIDEYGNTYGLVTLEDILEEIVGEIYDEFETKESFIEKIDEITFRLSGKAPIDLVNEELNLAIPAGGYETLAGYILFLFKKIPQEGESIKRRKFSFLIEKMAGRRIKSVILKIV